jgi:hypothetical protein
MWRVLLEGLMSMGIATLNCSADHDQMPWGWMTKKLHKRQLFDFACMYSEEVPKDGQLGMTAVSGPFRHLIQKPLRASNTLSHISASLVCWRKRANILANLSWARYALCSMDITTCLQTDQIGVRYVQVISAALCSSIWGSVSLLAYQKAFSSRLMGVGTHIEIWTVSSSHLANKTMSGIRDGIEHRTWLSNFRWQRLYVRDSFVTSFEVSILWRDLNVARRYSGTLENEIPWMASSGMGLMTMQGRIEK